jgi:hypothetical protein
MRGFPYSRSCPPPISSPTLRSAWAMLSTITSREARGPREPTDSQCVQGRKSTSSRQRPNVMIPGHSHDKE